MPTADQITDTTPTVDTIAELIEQECAHWAEPPAGKRARALARDVLAALAGRDDTPGPLDRYELRAYQAGPEGKPMVFWYCPRTHGDGNDAGHIGVIARDLDGDQTGLTLGEILAAVLEHERDERDEHDGPAI